ncbi:hypothetical protein EHI8A_037020 [Entamoeba histolytica HM-1:IMSS-B]|uniref:Uncharacterized protein n=6 Tax=Entamoeba histolytica TaxID=5759 RepID=B1N2Z5_ENTH1|nr:hypothetical protein EHI_051410 [Entamoeba histolytica HM-1:IMSS]EMD43348.1 Hypothetical protein EHI5A_053550 [Entamoeba histolytica KU27]EMH75639.1 hypothetical protein EHI8A_037020 [Entamoeba histolytica HM-1:IMSS-B]EMS17751.1 hypothetical protein KM1_075130 [Entamoeba histolytica HM-3:IMSS]ENY60705.1 hypothetical protein EHI7A_038500 [Entamoeba histolytica HM-1:IMSS-A]GAT93727.1 hypothetical protein CL6EHI_051410 [Entamoeba histolytica]|eukprot:XP_001913561.1 hypothetical protein EHI_051410 [Entamoeba histolytica HM-1:IMSS]
MKSLQNPKPFEEMQSLVPQVIESLEKMRTEAIAYLECFSDKKFESIQDEMYDESIKKLTELFNHVNEIECRNKNLADSTKKVVNYLDQTQKKSQEILSSIEQDGIYFD